MFCAIISFIFGGLGTLNPTTFAMVSLSIAFLLRHCLFAVCGEVLRCTVDWSCFKTLPDLLEAHKVIIPLK